MVGATGISSRAGGRQAIVALGALYVAIAVGFPFIPIVEDVSRRFDLAFGILVVGPGLLLMYGGYRLPRSDIRPQFFGVIARWCVGGIGAILGLLVLAAIVSGSPNPVRNNVILTALASNAGFIAGTREARAKTRARDLEETVERLKRSNEHLEQFAYAVSHDLQEPLRMVSSHLQLVENRYADDLDEDARDFIDFAVNGADRMRGMVASLLDYSRVIGGGAPLEPVDAGEIFGRVRDDLLRTDETDATVTADDLPTVTGDAHQLSQVFHHLLSNALAYSGDEPPRVTVSAERLDDAWQFTVADEGTGIDPKYHDRIFDVFERLHTNEKSLEAGTGGIGLALCERIIERHGGEIRVESELGDGATFYFTIPATHERQPLASHQ